MSEREALGPRARNRAAIEAALRDVGRRHLAEHGAAALSLRAVARDIGIAPSALYRYVRSRDDLLTLLIVDAYDDLADALDAATTPADPPRTAFVAFATALRAWARSNAGEYALIYGSPVPGYHAPGDVTRRSGTRPLALLASLAVRVDAVPEVPGTSGSTQRAAAAALAPAAADPAVPRGADPASIARTIAVWNLLLGSIASELFEQLGPVTDDPDAVYAGITDLAAALLFG
ncbi:TetR/AcrR family transcriptional regulator [Gordonia shandongensis]|uniref:TetR/AcrR family transcriptional regulator n=1 Tax=Gordonia shandongensis TaxID=376351 RepID=UPI00042A0E32|nr:TetR-like C-terminal domain-containing protein [Gordonia shandongensis]